MQIWFNLDISLATSVGDENPQLSAVVIREFKETATATATATDTSLNKRFIQ